MESSGSEDKTPRSRERLRTDGASSEPVGEKRAEAVGDTAFLRSELRASNDQSDKGCA